MKSLFTFLFLCVASPMLFAQGIKGRVLSSDGEPLPFATIYVSQTGSGSVSNAYGMYELKLNPGRYSITFQYLGYATEKLDLEIGDQVQMRDVILQKQAFLLSAAEVKGGKEDPSYTIIRKAIAKSSFHRQQVDKYTCEVYLKGGGGIVGAPGFIQKMLESEGIDTSTTFVSESVSRITYERPDQYNEEVISIRTSGNDRESSPMSYINGSFYEPKIGNIISPLSPRAFAYYRFQYLSSYVDQGVTINKIQVIPKSRSEDVVRGVIYIVDGLWCIHSVDLTINVQGIEIAIKQVFAPVMEEVWLPISHRFDGKGKIFGVKFEFGYLAAVSNYEVELNPDLSVPIVVIDEKIEKEALREREGKPEISGKELSESVEKRLEAGEELTRKELRKLLTQYEKEERNKMDEPEVMATRKFSIDTTAYNSDSSYWESRRPIPLTYKEVKGYNYQDSISDVMEKKAEGDTLGTRKKFRPGQLLTGGNWQIGESTYLRIHSPLTALNYNTVDGFNFEYRLSWYKRYENKSRLEISPMFRANLARPKSMGTLQMRYNYVKGPRKGELLLEGGVYYSQFNPNNPIPPFQNSFSTLIFQNNFMKVYDRDFIKMSWTHDVIHNITIRPALWYEQRTETFNNTSAVWFPQEGRSFTPNAPSNIGLENTGFGQSDAFKVSLSVTYRPGLEYGKYNQNYYIRNRPPEITAQVTRAIPDVFNSSIDYTRLNLIFKNWFDLRIGGELGVRAEAGMFVNARNIEFPDYMHFMGNQTIFTRFGQINGFSLLEYYERSNSDQYLNSYFNYTGRKFLLTRLPILRMSGLKENIMFNYLMTSTARNYMEIGYSLTNVFRVARIDFVTGFVDGQYREFRIQFGILSEMFGVE